LRSKYDYFFTEKWYGYLSGSYEKDSIADLDRRVIIGTGAGYQWVESKEMNFSTEAGLASVYERYEGADDSESELSAELGYHFDKLLGKENKLKFINDLSYFPALGDPADYYLTTTAELRAPITEQTFTNFKVVFDYDSTPASGADKTDVKYIFGAGVNW
jgi:putative salt-induced outer membrane protein YdiY